MPGWRRVIVSAAAVVGVCALVVVPRLHGQRPNPLSPHESSTVTVDGARITIECYSAEELESVVRTLIGEAD